MNTNKRHYRARLLSRVLVGTLLIASVDALSSLAAFASPGSGGASAGSTDSIVRIRITRDPPQVTVDMSSGVQCTPGIQGPLALPMPGVYRGDKSHPTRLTISGGGRSWTLRLIPRTRLGSDHECAGFLNAHGRFLVEVWQTSEHPPDPSLLGSGRTGRGVADQREADGAGRADGGDSPSGPSGHTAETAEMAGGYEMVGGVAIEVRDALLRRLRALGMDSSAADRIARGFDNERALTFADALAVLEATHGDITAAQNRNTSKQDWTEWARFLQANRDVLAGKVQIGRDAISIEEARGLLARYMRQAGVVDPPVLTGAQRQAQLHVDPELAAAWGRLKQWERNLWLEYWRRLPDATQSNSSSRKLRMTQRVRFSIALQLSVTYMDDGFREAAWALVNDSTFIGVVVGGITLYAVAVMLPEPLFSKLTAATITAFLLAASFTIHEVIGMVKAWFRLRKQAGRARTMAELERAAKGFGTTIGGAGFRIMLTLFTYFAGTRLAKPQVGSQVQPGPGAGAVLGGGAAVTTALPRVAFVGGTRLVVLENGAVVIAPMAMAAVVGGERAAEAEQVGVALAPMRATAVQEIAAEPRASPATTPGSILAL